MNTQMPLLEIKFIPSFCVALRTQHITSSLTFYFLAAFYFFKSIVVFKSIFVFIGQWPVRVVLVLDVGRPKTIPQVTTKLFTANKMQWIGFVISLLFYSHFQTSQIQGGLWRSTPVPWTCRMCAGPTPNISKKHPPTFLLRFGMLFSASKRDTARVYRNSRKFSAGAEKNTSVIANTSPDPIMIFETWYYMSFL